MPDQEVDAMFEDRFARRLADFADEAVRPFDAVEITRVAAAGRSPATRPRTLFPAWARAFALATLLLVTLVAAGIAGGIIRLPSNDIVPNPTFQPFSPEPGTALPSPITDESADPSLPVTFVPGSDPPTTLVPPTLPPATGSPVPPSQEPTEPPSPSAEPTSPEPSIEPSPEPMPVAVAAVDAGDLHACALAIDGRIFCWGDNETGALGDGTQLTRFTAEIPVSGIDDGLAVSSGIRFSCAIRADRSVWCWGEDPGSDENHAVPQRVPDIDDATAVTAGGAFACALRAGGGVACWGNGQIGQLGNGVFENNSGVPSPQAVVGIDDAVAISSGWNHTCALRSDRTIWCWGGNGDGATAYGSLGDGTFEQRRATPAPVVGIDDAIAVEAGGWSTCAMRADRSVWCWGYGERGTLGDGNATNSATPVQVLGMSDAQTLALGRWHACVSRSDDSVWCWGDIDWGGGGGDKATPVQGFRSQDAIAMSTDRFLLVIDRDRVLWQWGFGSVNVPEQMPVGP